VVGHQNTNRRNIFTLAITTENTMNELIITDQFEKKYYLPFDNFYSYKGTIKRIQGINFLPNSKKKYHPELLKRLLEKYPLAEQKKHIGILNDMIFAEENVQTAFNTMGEYYAVFTIHDVLKFFEYNLKEYSRFIDYRQDKIEVFYIYHYCFEDKIYDKKGKEVENALFFGMNSYSLELKYLNIRPSIYSYMIQKYGETENALIRKIISFFKHFFSLKSNCDFDTYIDNWAKRLLKKED
jgi:hypothetical protein